VSVVDALLSGRRFGKFASVGVVGAVFDVTTATALRELGVFPELAVFVGIEVAIVVMFLLNDNWTFAEEGAAGVGAAARRLLRSNLVRAGGILVQLATFGFLFRVVALELQVAGVDGWFVLSKVAGIGAGMVVNYVAESVVTWQVGRG
jgi:putative flippase GtrA